MLSWEFQQFYPAWLAKADQYRTDDLKQLFDKFFTLYVLYNRVYAEATFQMSRDGRIPQPKNDRFPDAKAATDYIIQFLGAKFLNSALDADEPCNLALLRICELIEQERFHILLDIVTGIPRRDDDVALAQSLRSRNTSRRAKAIVRTVYAIRCNLFHGHKEFAGVQSQLLLPVTTVLRKIIELVFTKLESSH